MSEGNVFETIWQGKVTIPGGDDVFVSVSAHTDPTLSQKQIDKLGKILGDCIRDNLDKVIQCDCCD